MLPFKHTKETSNNVAHTTFKKTTHDNKPGAMQMHNKGVPKQKSEYVINSIAFVILQFNELRYY